MSLKQEIETWVSALNHYDNNEFEEALRSFDSISDTSKILFNMGVIHATLGEHEQAVDCYTRAIKLDTYLAVAYFQQGVSNFLMGDFDEALANFNDTLLYLRGNNNIDYEQLGLKFKLYACEVLFNRGLCYIYLQQTDQGMQDLAYAAKEKVVPDHDVIDEAIAERAEGYTVFSIPVGIVYRPNEAKVKNLKAKDYLGKARLVAATDRSQTFTGFTGAEIKKLNGPEAAKDDRSEDKISFAASNLVKTDIKASRSRQQSEPPVSRNVFPPTPPPESDKTQEPKPLTRADTVRAGPKPRPLDLTVAGFDQPTASNPAGPLARPRRAESEKPVSARSSTASREGLAPAFAPVQRRSTERNLANRSKRTSPEEANYPEDVYDMYGRQSFGPPKRSDTKVMRPISIQEEGDEDDDDYNASYDEGEFEMVSSKVRRSTTSAARRSAPEIRKIRVKVHADDTRYVMVGPAVEFRDFVDQIRQKFGIRQSFKVKVKDDEDMITMADQDDLDMAIESAKSGARKERTDMAKMEVWIQAV